MERHAFRLKVKPGCEEEYIRHHQNVLPELLKKMHDAGIRNYSIFMDGTELFGYLESENLEASWTKMNAGDQTPSQNWGKLMDPLFDYLEPREQKQVQRIMKQVFYME